MNYKNYFIVIILFLFNFYSLYSFSLDDFFSKIEVDKANRLFKKGDYDNAVKLYEKALSKVTNSSELYYNMATTMSFVGEREYANNLFEMSKSSINKKTSKKIKNSIYYNSGVNKILMEDYEGAIKDLVEALVNKPKDENSKRALEYAQKQLKDQKNNSGEKPENNDDNNNENNESNNESENSQDNNENNNLDNENKEDNSSNKNSNNNENNNDIDRLLESLRSLRKAKENTNQYYGGGRIDKDW